VYRNPALADPCQSADIGRRPAGRPGPLTRENPRQIKRRVMAHDVQLRMMP